MLSTSDDTEIRNEIDVTLDLEAVNVLLTALLKIAEPRFHGFPLRDVLNYYCWMATIPAPALDARGIQLEGVDPSVLITELAASIARVNLNVTCVECSSPRMFELTELLSSSSAQKEATEVFNHILGYVAELLGGTFLQVQIDRVLNDAARKCPHRPEYDFNASEVVYEPFEVPPNEYSTTYLALLGGVTFGLILVVAFVAFCVRCIVRRRHRKWLSTLPQKQVRRLALQQAREQALESQICNNTMSMFTSPDIPVFIRWFMPVVLVGNIALFLSGHMSLGATVNIEAQLAGETFKADNFFEFSMAKSTVDIWNAGGYGLAILILIFSGIWPYTKTLMTLALWFIPPTRVSVSKRGSILLWLDWLAKWSIIDIFVLVISIAAFRYEYYAPNVRHRR
jgi:Paraquat-inducible protein A